jgi:hypothetical protein
MNKSYLPALVAGVLSLGAPQALAAPVTLPDVNFAAIASGRTGPSLPLGGNAPILFYSGGIEMSVLTSVGDQISQNSGSGFVPQTNWAVQVFNGTGAATSTGFKFTGIDLYFGATSTLGFAESFAPGGGTLTLTKNALGYVGFGTFTLTDSGLPGFHVGEKVGIDLIVTNIGTASFEGVTFFTGDVKGDVAPVVPEPGSLSLLAIGLVGLVARRRLV